jgi:hypothetical protein
MPSRYVLVALLGLAGCGGAEGVVDTTKLKVPSAEEQEAIKAFDNQVNDEEFGKPMPGSKPSVPRKK